MILGVPHLCLLFVLYYSMRVLLMTILFKFGVPHLLSQFRFTWLLVPWLMIRTWVSACIKTFRDGDAREYLYTIMCSLLASHDTIYQQTCPHTHEQNGVVEHKHRQIFDAACALCYASVPLSFWVVRVMNNTPNSVLSRLTSPRYDLLRAFGCCYVFLPSHDRDKLAPHTNLCFYLGSSL